MASLTELSETVKVARSLIEDISEEVDYAESIILEMLAEMELYRNKNAKVEGAKGAIRVMREHCKMCKPNAIKCNDESCHIWQFLNKGGTRKQGSPFFAHPDVLKPEPEEE